MAVMAGANSQAMALQAPGHSHQVQVVAVARGGFSPYSGLSMRRTGFSVSGRTSLAAAGGLLGLPIVKRRRGRVLCAVVEPSGDDSGSDKDDEPEIASVDGAAKPVDSAAFKSRRDMLQEYVKNVQPEFMERFVQKAPSQVVEAMRQTVTSMLGTLPPQFFDIHVSTIAENLAQLMYSVMMTGYMFRNAQYRLELQQSLSQPALPVSSSATTDSRYAPGTQKSAVSGDVVRWRKDEEKPERVDAIEYIELLEAEVEELRKQLEMRGRGKNELLEYLKSLQPQNLQELTTSAGEDALEAMNTFVSRLIGVAEPTQLKRAATQTTAAELARILYWLMVVGYSIRNIEVRYDMERVLGMPAKLAELPPGENL
ncbi:hypothetical protein KC19_3G095400 [Ceratodon purpureus]|uniref:Uncharacterized protein n=2 Tax=Ceratodon purpureus TaxID=3225 RepID=A0A8T0IJ19_CERPU|nr:hypothetical protein KC19_3G095400 [Ceratodon purpureus]